MSLPEHFLERLERLNGTDLDRAMRMFHHRDELRRVITAAVQSAVPALDADARIAVPLRDTGDASIAPRVVLTRTGEFVTCLGEGMRADNLHEVPYARFEAALLARAALDPASHDSQEKQRRFSYGSLFRSMTTLGRFLAREHIDWLLAHGDVVGPLFVRSLESHRLDLERIAEAIKSRRFVAPEIFMTMERLRWAYNLQMLIAAESGERRVARHAWDVLFTGGSAIAFYAAATLGKLYPQLPALLRARIRDVRLPMIVRARMMFAVACAGLSHPGRRDQARETLQAMVDGDEPALAGFGRAMLDAIESTVILPRNRQWFPIAPLDPALTGGGEVEMSQALVIAYRPLREWAAPLDVSLQLYREQRQSLETRGRLEIPHRAGTPVVRKEPAVGRNDQCTCGSGRKFKKCCARAARDTRVAA